MDITIESVTRVRVSAIEENEIEEDEDEEELYYRTLTIVMESGQVISLDLYATSPEALEIDEDEE